MTVGSEATAGAFVREKLADFWLGLQQDWDLWHALNSDRAAVIEELEPLPQLS